MAKTKKKMKPAAKKKAKPAAKKAVKSSVKKKTASTSRKKTRVPAKKKMKPARKDKTKNRRAKRPAPRVRKIITAPETVSAPEIEKQNEVMHPAHIHKAMDPQMTEDSKKLERRVLGRKNVTMNAENQKVKSAMAKRHSMKPIYHGLRGG